MKVTYIKLLDREYPLCFSLSAYEETVEKFGSTENLYAALTSENEAEIVRGLKIILPILMKAGRIYAQAIGEQSPPELPCNPADVMDARDPASLLAIFSAIKNDGSRSVETVPKNGEATPEP